MKLRKMIYLQNTIKLRRIIDGLRFKYRESEYSHLFQTRFNLLYHETDKGEMELTSIVFAKDYWEIRVNQKEVRYFNHPEFDQICLMSYDGFDELLKILEKEGYCHV